MEELLDESSREKLLEQLMEEVATASSLRGLLAADGGTKKTSIDIACDMVIAQLNIALYLKVSKNKLEKQVESLKATVEAKDKELEGLEQVIAAFSGKLKESEGLSAQVESYKGLELSYHTEIEALSKQLEGLKAISETKAREIEGLKQTISELTGKLQESEDARSNMSLSLMDIESKLSDKDKELDSLSAELDKVQAAWQDLYLKDGSHTAEVAYYKQQAKKAEETSAGLREEIKGLKAQQQQTALQKPTKGSTKFQKVYTDEQRQQMAEIYKACHYKRKLTWEQVKAQMGISISETSLVRILQEQGVFKSTYRKRKKPTKKQ